MDDTRVVVLAKAPVAGYAKTRLIAALGAPAAARLAERLLDHTLAQARAAGLGEVELCCAPDTTHAAFANQARRGGIRLTTQDDGDLGQRMHAAVERGLRRAAQVLLIGTDAPALDAAYLRAAAAALRDSDVVIGPAADGGYALIGVRRSHPWLFDAMPWSSDRVAALTRERVAARGLQRVELPQLFDIDEPDDLQHLPEGWR